MVVNESRSSQVDWQQVDWHVLLSKLTACGLRWFRLENCHDADAVLPGTGISAVDLVYDAIVHVLNSEVGSRLVATDGNPYPYILTVMRHDFLDLVKQGREYRRTVIADESEGCHAENLFEDALDRPDAYALSDAASLVRKLHLILGSDIELKEYVTAWLMDGLDKRADIAYHLGVSEQEITTRKRRLIYKLKPYAQAFAGVQAGGKRYD